MMRTIVWFVYFWCFMLVSLTFFVPLIILRLLKMKDKEEAFVHFITGNWARSLIRVAGGKVILRGEENIPLDRPCCIISNHQGAFDIPLIIGHMPRVVGFIAKKELKYIPLVSSWMKAIHCVFIDRGNRRAGLASIKLAVEHMNNGHSLVIFPEATRSRSSSMAKFKSGSLKVPLRAEAAILPVTIDGSYLMKEANKGLIKPASVTLTFHPVIQARSFSKEQSQELAAQLYETVGSALSKESVDF